MEWRFGTPSQSFNIDETTTSVKLGGGYSPSSFASKTVIIAYGIISRCLLKKGLSDRLGNIIGFGANLLLDELNRTDFENIAFLMGFLENPYEYSIEEEGRPILNPNNRNDLDFEMRWLLDCTMNIQDVGNQPISYAFKSRFHIMQIRYTQEQVEKILTELYRFSSKSGYEAKIFKNIYTEIDAWRTQLEIKFPAGIRHYNNFFTYLRSGMARLEAQGEFSLQNLKIRNTDLTIQEYILISLRSAILMPIIDENKEFVITEKEDQIKDWSVKFSNYIIDFLKERESEYKKSFAIDEARQLALDELDSIIY